MGNIISDCCKDKEKKINHHDSKKLINKNHIYVKNNILLCRYCKKYEKCVMHRKGIAYQHCHICERYIDKINV